MEIPELGAGQAQARALADARRQLEQEAVDGPPEMLLAKYAYTVAYSTGEVYTFADLDEAADVQRKPSLDEMYGALRFVSHNSDLLDQYSSDDGTYEWAFLVATTDDGRTLLFDTVDVPVSTQNPPSVLDVFMAAEIVLSDLISSKTAMKSAQASVQGLVGLGKQAAEAQREAQANQAAMAEAQKKFGPKR